MHTLGVMTSRAVRVGAQTPLFWVAASIIVLNLFDAILTLTVVHAGAAAEANPLMEVSLSWGAIWFVLVKLSIVSLGVQLLWRQRRVRLAAIGLVGVCVLYMGVVAYQLAAIGASTWPA
jgi:hypothetical protein